MKNTYAVYKRIFSVILAGVLLLGTFPDVYASTETLAEQIQSGQDNAVSFEYGRGIRYSDLLDSYQKNGYMPASVKTPLRFFADECSSTDGTLKNAGEEGHERAILWESENEFLEWTARIPESGLYSLSLTYKSLDAGSDIVRAFTVNGELPCEEFSTLPLYRQWKSIGKPRVNSAGDEVRSGVRLLSEWQTAELTDVAGRYEQSLQIYLEKGTNTLRLSLVNGSVIFDCMELFSPVLIPLYSDVKKAYDAEGYMPAEKGYIFEAEGDHMTYTNNSTLRMSNDGDPLVSPQKTGRVVMNVLGGTLWQSANSAVTWEFTVPESGLYMIALRLRQNYREGLPSYRKLEIDGQVPFRELETYRFAYDKNWRTEALSDQNGEPFYIYLESGCSHTLTMTAKQGELNKITQVLIDDSSLLSETIRKITMITGQSPDLNFDYEIDKKIPNLLQTLTGLAANMRICMNIMEGVSGEKPSKYYQLESMIAQFNSMVSNPFSIPRRINDINTVLTTYGEWISQMEAQPLLLDFIEIAPAGAEIKSQKSSLISRVWTGIVNFFLSFTKDYDSVWDTSEDEASGPVLDIWIGRGKDWGMLLKQMADEEFTPKYGSSVRVNILPAGQLNSGSVNAMLLAVSSGRAPDIGMAVDTSSIGEFALRDALYDLKSFSNFQEVSKRFLPELFTPMTYQDGVYGLPETTRFTMLFYRKDILSQLKLTIPDTWNDLYSKVIPVLYQNNMQFYIPAANETENENSFAMFLYQMGGSYFSDDLRHSLLDQSSSYLAFKEYSELFTRYGVPVSANFFNRFRTGETPIGISDTYTYIQLMAAAPELDGKWGVVPIMGHETADGKINRSHIGILAESSMILNQSKHPDACWEFLNWWTSTEVQTRYGSEIEALQGKGARWSTANLEAFSNMPWFYGDLPHMLESYKQVSQVPVVLGGYFSKRHIYNAFNRTVISKQNPRDSLEEAVKDINKELLRKREGTNQN